MAQEFQKETEIFQKNRSEWVKSYLNKWVWINEDNYYFFESYEDAVKKAYSDGYDSVPIFIKKITEQDEQEIIAGYSICT